MKKILRKIILYFPLKKYRIGVSKILTTNEYFENYYFDYIYAKVISNTNIVSANNVFSQLNDWKFQNAITISPKIIEIYRLEDAKIWCGTTAIVTKEGVILRDISRVFDNKKKYLHPLQSCLFVRSSQYLHGVSTCITTSGQDVYYHWLFDVLPRYLLLNKNNLVEKVDNILVQKLATKFQYESLALINFPFHKIKEYVTRNSYIHCENLVITSLFSSLGNVHPQAINLLRESYLPLISPQRKVYPKKIFISRKKSSGRKLLNEEAIATMLQEQFGFEKIYTEELNFINQIELYYNAEIIIAPHGSGLANIVFCNSNATVIELFDKNFVVACFYSICYHLNLKYFPLFNGYINKNYFLSYWQQSASDFEFNVDELKNMLKQIL